MRTFEPRREKIRLFAFAKTKTQISFAVTAKLISAFVFAIRIGESLFYRNPKFQASSHILWLYSTVCVGPGRKPRRPVFSQRGSFAFGICEQKVTDQLVRSPLASTCSCAGQVVMVPTISTVRIFALMLK